MSWFEEQRFEWIPATASALEQVMEGKSIVLITDHDRKWFAHYLTASINKRTQDRPMIPIVCIDSLFPHYDQISGGEAIDTLIDMLDITFKGEYFFWYVGRGDERRADIAKRNGTSLIWSMDEISQSAIHLRSYDPLIDIRLLQLYRLFDKTLGAFLFGEINVRE